MINITPLARGIALVEGQLLCLGKPVIPAEVQSDGMETVIARNLSSALGGTRTPNLLIRNQMLYPIELRALNLLCKDLILANSTSHALARNKLLVLV